METDPTPKRTYRQWLRQHRRWLLIGAGVAVATAVAVPLILVATAWSRIERVDLDPAAARRQLADSTSTSTTTTVTVTAAPTAEDLTTTSTTAAGTSDDDWWDPDFHPWVTTIPDYPLPPPVPRSAPVADDVHQAILIVGSDQVVGASRRADVIMLALLPAGSSEVLLVSLPRDLYLDDPCGGGRARINAALNGCGGVSGPNLLSIVVEDFTGIPVDHFVLFDFAGFARVIDIAGGVQVCVDHPTYDKKTDPDLDLPAGCSTLDGRMALSWVRSRHTREIVDGVDRAVRGVGDGTRNARQRNVVLQMIRKLSRFSNPADIVSLARAAPGAFTLDSGLSLGDAVGIAWSLRGRADSVRSPRIPLVQYTTREGAWVVVPTEPFSKTIG